MVMKLQTRLLLMGASTIVVCFGAFEVLSYRQAAEFFTQHEMRMQNGGEPDALLAVFQQEKLSLLWELATLRVLSVLGAMTALSVALHLLWGRLVARPVNLLLARMNSMSRGTWTQPIPIEREDEIGQLVGEFNLLGPRLTFAAHQYAAASKLAALALIGQRVTRRTHIAGCRLAEIQQLLLDAHNRGTAAPQAAVEQIGFVTEELADLAADLEAEFNAELVRQGLPRQAGSTGQPQRPGSGIRTEALGAG